MKLLFTLFLTLLLSACQTTSRPSTPVESAEEELNNLIEEEGLNNLVGIEVNEPPELLANKHYDNLWLKLAEGFTFDVPDNERIEKLRDYYLSHPTYLHRVSKRAEPFLFLIIEQIENKELPLELALLPVVESTFDPFAYSSAGASGLWQFMPVSGARFGLQQNWWYDGRRDVYAATDSALRYMELLHRYLGDDWLYAFAAYNSGEGRVKRAIEKNKNLNKPVDYWNLALPKETQKYVPKLLALIDIMRNHKEYGVELPYIANQEVLTYVDTGSQIDLAYAAELADLTVAEIQLLNPGFNHWATAPDGPHKLLLPSVVSDQFSEKLSKVSKHERLRWDRYSVKAGDSLSVIAKNHATTTTVLKQINELDSSLIKVGQPLLIPIGSKSLQQSLSVQATRLEKQAKQNNKTKIAYQVIEGDTLWDISRRYKVTTKQIANWNNFDTTSMLSLGQNLIIWKNTPKSDAKPITRRVSYHVRTGDSLGVIAKKFNVKTADLIKWNNLQDVKYIRPGQKLKVYVDVKNSNT